MDDKDIVFPSPELVVLRTWGVSRLSFFGSIVPIYFYVVGTVLIVLGAYFLISDWRNSQRLGFAWMIFVGCVGIGLGTFFLNYVVRRIEMLSGGMYRFVSRRRSLVLDPKNIESLKGLGYFMDFWGMYPFRMKAGAGSIFIDRHMRDGKDLEYELRRANPRMIVTRAWGRDEADTAPWRDDEVWEP
ncbi:MAG TPA: hypothetical protein VHV57_10360 [Acidimicrobiales bacterium]|nr:hypothetical protein [Acidimicrobiales bacterium]